MPSGLPAIVYPKGQVPYNPGPMTRSDADEDAETLRRVDALGDAGLSQALREALERRRQRDEDEDIPDLFESTESVNDEAKQHKVAPPFALLRLNTDVRRKVLAFLVCASEDRALRAMDASRVPKPQATQLFSPGQRRLVAPPKVPAVAVEVCTRRRGTSTVLRGAPPPSTAALLSTLFHHTAALRLVCTALRTDLASLWGAARSTATPKSWLANLYCRREPTLRNGAAVHELRAHALSGRRANAAREIFSRRNACAVFVPPEYGQGLYTGDPDYDRFFARGGRVLFTKLPSQWSNRRRDMARGLVYASIERKLNGTAGHPCARFLTVDEANRNAPVDGELLRRLTCCALSGTLDSFQGRKLALVLDKVSVQWRAFRGEGGSRSPPPECCLQFAEQLDQFFGDRSGDGWIRRWSNISFHDYDDGITGSGSHDASRPPFTTLAELFSQNDSHEGRQAIVDLTTSTTIVDTFRAFVDVEIADAPSRLVADSYVIGVSSTKCQLGTSSRAGCHIVLRPGCAGVELFVNFLGGRLFRDAPGDTGPGYFLVGAQARVPGFD